MNMKKTIKVIMESKFEDIKKGDLVITGEIHRVVKVFNTEEKSFSVVTIKPKCDVCFKHKHKCNHQRVMSLGYGQQSFLKIRK